MRVFQCKIARFYTQFTKQSYTSISISFLIKNYSLYYKLFNVARVLGLVFGLRVSGVTVSGGCYQRDDMLERSIARAQATRSVSWLRRKVQWTFRASSAERRLAVRTALRSYTLFGLSGCVVKFSFLLTFSAKIVFVNEIITIVPLLYCSTKQHPPLTRKFTHHCFLVWQEECLEWHMQQHGRQCSLINRNQRLRSATAKLYKRASIQAVRKISNLYHTNIHATE